jgi:hypothetical protein
MWDAKPFNVRGSSATALAPNFIRFSGFGWLQEKDKFIRAKNLCTTSLFIQLYIF